MKFCEKLKSMTKYLLPLSLLICTTLAFAGDEWADQNQAEESISFEAELRMLEQQDEAAFKRAENLTEKALNGEDELMSDTVSTSNAAVKKDHFEDKKSGLIIQPPSFKPRRVRSR